MIITLRAMVGESTWWVAHDIPQLSTLCSLNGTELHSLELLSLIASKWQSWLVLSSQLVHAHCRVMTSYTVFINERLSLIMSPMQGSSPDSVVSESWYFL